MMPFERRRQRHHEHELRKRRHLFMVMATLPVWLAGWVNIINWWLT